MNDIDQASFRNNDESRVSEIDGKHLCLSVSEGAETVAICKDTAVSVPYQVSLKLNSSLNEEQAQGCQNGSVTDREHLQVPVIDKECDHNVIRDIWVDEGVSSQNRNSLISQDNFELEKYKLSDSTQVKRDALPEVSSNSVACQADGDKFLDFDSLLGLAETGNSQTQGITDHIVDKGYFDELLASANNPFLEDSMVETSLGDEKIVCHPSNPFGFEGTLHEPEGNSIVPDETSNKYSIQNDSVEGVISSKNPFLDTQSFKLAKDDFEEAEKISGNDVTVEGAVKKNLTSHDDDQKTTSDGMADVPRMTSTVNSIGAGDKMKVPDQSNNPANGSQLQHDPLESSFATTNPYPVLISYSGQIPFSGSMSLRSESSATSNRSFAFPVLQTEWKASPVRMAKADRKHNSWKHTFLCCNF